MSNPYQSILEAQKTAFLPDRIKSRDLRTEQPDKTACVLADHRKRWTDALHGEFGSPPFQQECEITEPNENIAYHRGQRDARAAEHMTPVILESGGQSPSLVDATAHIDRAADCTAWGHMAISGKRSILPGYVCAQEAEAIPFAEKRITAVIRMHAENSRDSPAVQQEGFGPVLPILRYSDLDTLSNTKPMSDSPTGQTGDLFPPGAEKDLGKMPEVFS